MADSLSRFNLLKESIDKYIKKLQDELPEFANEILGMLAEVEYSSRWKYRIVLEEIKKEFENIAKSPAFTPIVRIGGALAGCGPLILEGYGEEQSRLVRERILRHISPDNPFSDTPITSPLSRLSLR